MSKTKSPRSFDKQAAERRVGLVAEFYQFLRHNRKWWLVPLLVVLLGLGVLVVLGGTGAAPILYTLF